MEGKNMLFSEFGGICSRFTNPGSSFSVSMDRLTVRECVHILTKDPYLIWQWKQFAYGLHITDSLDTLERQYRVGAVSPYELFTDILLYWVSKEGRKATLEKLVSTLESRGFIYTADVFRNQFELALPIFYDLEVSTSATEIPSPEEDAKWLDTLKMQECLGNGSFGIVLKAINKSGLTVPTAIKFIFPHPDRRNADDEDKRLRECKNMRNNLHENVVTYKRHVVKKFSVGELKLVLQAEQLSYSGEARDVLNVMTGRFSISPNRTLEVVCIEMELCGATLRSWLNEDDKIGTLRKKTSLCSTQLDGLQPEEIMSLWKVEVGRGIVSGLNYLHGQAVPILHRDLKPENIYFSLSPLGPRDYQPPVKIGDFGLSRTLPGDASITLTKRRGTPLYRAHEVKLGKYGKRADRYSMGLILFELFELIPYKELETSFEDLIHYPDSVLDMKHDRLVRNFKEIVLKLTRRFKKDRYDANHPIVLDLTDEYEHYNLC